MIIEEFNRNFDTLNNTDIVRIIDEYGVHRFFLGLGRLLRDNPIRYALICYSYHQAKYYFETH